MAIVYTFFDYIDESGANIIKCWLNGDGKLAKAHFTNLIPQLEHSTPPHFNDTVWRIPHYKPLENKKGQKWEGFAELRKLGKIQYRIIIQIQDHKVFLVACGVHKGQKFDIDVPPKTARLRVAQMIANPAKYRREHEFD
jgi:hypothetical protein